MANGDVIPSDPNETKSRLVAFLQSPSSYPHRPATVRLIQTHISWVFFAPPFVFKVKKPVNFGFLDFSSLERRHHFCQREVDLNRRLAPETYDGVLPIFRHDDTFSFEPNGEVAEYCVKMKELPDGFFLHQLLERGLVSEMEINRILSCLCRFYETETSTQEVEGWGTPEKLRITTDDNLALLEKFAGDTITPGALRAIRLFTNNFYRFRSELLEERVRQHRIRDCHGDLRLDHIHLTPDRLTIFDCIEFNDRLRFIDIANDLAFLAMDFDFAGHRDLADLLLQNAFRELSDPGLLKVVEFYKCYRALVRGKVESIEAISCEPGRKDEHINYARRYFHLALRYALFGSSPTILVVMGSVGTGKSTLANQLASEVGWPVFSSDHIRKTLAGVPLTTRLQSAERKPLYSDEMTTTTYRRLFAEGTAALAKQGGVVLDATFARRVHREFLRQECVKAGVHLQVIELPADQAEIKRRLKAREKSTKEISDARLEDLEKLTAAYEPPTELADELIRLSTNAPVSETVAALLLEMVQRRYGWV